MLRDEVACEKDVASDFQGPFACVKAGRRLLLEEEIMVVDHALDFGGFRYRIEGCGPFCNLDAGSSDGFARSGSGGSE